MTLSAVNAQGYFHEYFENGGTQQTNVDGDGDGYKWRFVEFSRNQEHGQVTNSQSDYWGALLTPNNYLISPAITLGTTHLHLQYDVRGHSSNLAQEYYAVYVTTANDTATINAGNPYI